MNNPNGVKIFTFSFQIINEKNDLFLETIPSNCGYFLYIPLILINIKRETFCFLILVLLCFPKCSGGRSEPPSWCWWPTKSIGIPPSRLNNRSSFFILFPFFIVFFVSKQTLGKEKKSAWISVGNNRKKVGLFAPPTHPLSLLSFWRILLYIYRCFFRPNVIQFLALIRAAFDQEEKWVRERASLH